MRSPRTATKSSPHSPKPEKACPQQRRPKTAKNKNQINKFILKKERNKLSIKAANAPKPKKKEKKKIPQPRHIIVKLIKTIYKQKSLKATRKKAILHTEGQQ